MELLLRLSLGEDGGWEGRLPSSDSPGLFDHALKLVEGFPQCTWRAKLHQRYWAIPVTEPNVAYLRENYPAGTYEVDDEAKLALRVLEKRYEVTGLKERRRWEYLFNEKVPKVDYDSIVFVNDGKDTWITGSTPFQHQWVTLDAIHNAEFFALLMEQGTGKTPCILYEAAWQARRRDQFPHGVKVLVMCPKSVRTSWERAIRQHVPCDVKVWTGRLNRGPCGKVEQLIEGMRARADLKVWIIGHESVESAKEALQKIEFDLGVLDESTRAKHGSTKRSKAMREVARSCKRRFILTGTPITNNVHDVFYQFDFLEPGCLGYTTYNAFKARYEKYKRYKFNGRNHEEFVEWQNLEELKLRMARFSFAVKKSECLDLPDKIWMDPIVVTLTQRQRELYDDMQAQFFAQMGDDDSMEDVTKATIVLTQMLRLRQIVNGFIVTPLRQTKWIPGGNPKMEALMDLIEDHPKDQKVIVWADFRATIEAIHDAVEKRGIGCVKLYGGSGNSDTIEATMNDDYSVRVMVGNPAAGGMGVTLIGSKACPVTACVYYSSDWNMEYRAQSEDRCHRIGMHAPVTYYEIMGEQTIDEVIGEALALKKSLSEYCRNFRTLKDRLLRGPQVRLSVEVSQ